MSDGNTLRLLLLGDTHMGFDWPLRPRIARRRRGPDFLARFEEALEPALRGAVDVVVHGGDLLHHPRVPPALVHAAMVPLLRVADRGVPVFLVPGNHERSRIPFPLLTRHRHVHLFDEPRTFTGTWSGLRVSIAGFPFTRRVDADAFAERVAATGWCERPADIHLLCMHQAVEGATVGAHEFTFRAGPDVVPGHAIPRGLAAVLSGHIHRSQVLTHGLAGRPFAAPVVYAGSVERTAFTERDETKGCLLLHFRAGSDGGRLHDWTFRPVAARPMCLVELDVAGTDPERLARSLRRRLRALDPNAVVCVKPKGEAPFPLERVLAAKTVRALAPPSMNVSVAWPRPWRPARDKRRAAR